MWGQTVSSPILAVTAPTTRLHFFGGQCHISIGARPDHQQDPVATSFRDRPGPVTPYRQQRRRAASSGIVTVTDALPAGLTATSISGTGWTCTLSTLTCTRTDGLAGNSYPGITLKVNVAGSALGVVTNTAAVTGGGDLNPSNNSASDVTKILLPEPDLAISKSHSGNFAQGQAGRYTITVSNVGGSPAAAR